MKLPKIPGLSSLPNPFPPFGELVREHRTLHGMTVEELAAAVNISPGALREIEDGARTAPPENVVKLMANALHLTGDARDTFIDAGEWESSAMGALLGRKKPQKPALPKMSAAILVFLIADIRGYTHFTQDYGDQAAARLTTRFADITRSVMEQWSGHLIEVRGDEVMCVFASAQHALHAAHDLHARCIAEAETHPDLPLAIGIGLDVGEAATVDDGYRGAAINRAARLCSLAGAGETLISTGLAYIAPLVDGVTYVGRGQAQLKGFDTPVPILLAARSITTTAVAVTESATIETAEVATNADTNTADASNDKAEQPEQSVAPVADEES